MNALSTKDLRNLFKLRSGTPSDTHDKLKCERCKIIHDNAELEALKVLPKKLAACADLVEEMMNHEDASHFLKPLVSQDHGISKEAYDKIVKQPMDLGTVKSRLGMSLDQPSSYKSVSSVSKDVNRIFSNVLKVWAPGDPIADASRRLQSWWIERWTDLVPRLMVMKAEEDTKVPESESGLDPSELEACATLNNERGEDYQEQIGMPDEENMRHWSHHYNTDTVDDPVFRAAMRGTDAVSFVFGLEVTWSLIQQRQQEEEERQALRELEGMEELQNDEDSGEESVDEDGIVPIDEDDSSDDEEMEDKVIASDSSDESVASTSPPRQSPDQKSLQVESPSGDTTSTETLSEPLTADSSTFSNKENEDLTPSQDEWMCTSCTLFNKKAKRKCVACGARRQKAGSKRSINQL